jgi:hypothetical protein
VHVEVVNYLAGMEISTIVIGNVNMLCASLYDPSPDMTQCTLIIAIDQEQRCVFAECILVDLELPLCLMGSHGIRDVLDFEE